MKTTDILSDYAHNHGIRRIVVEAAARRLYPGIFRSRISPAFDQRLATKFRMELDHYFFEEAIYG